ncbi:hypothetical protein MKY91_20600 [Alkalicoccobacillus gibsonii]|uniref:Uncharacterized protein n=1 Tax=Alkalicoccobacillus gibsonii TaxID=79881 RepID=A0ABU9VNT0_9BACI
MTEDNKDKNLPETIIEAEYEELPDKDKKENISVYLGALMCFFGAVGLLGCFYFMEVYKESNSPQALTIEDLQARQAVSDKEKETRYEVVAEHLNVDVKNIILQSNNEFYDVFYEGDLYKANFDYEDDGQAILLNLAKTPFEQAKSDNSN